LLVSVEVAVAVSVSQHYVRLIHSVGQVDRYRPSICNKMGWFQSSNNRKDEHENEKLPPQLAWMAEYISLTPSTQDALDQLQLFTPVQVAAMGVACAASFFFGYKTRQFRQGWRRLTSVADISAADVGPTAPWLRGRVLKVSDGDTFRFLHTPTMFSATNLAEGEKMSETALAVRVCTIDTPETAKFGKPSQPYGDTAKEYLQSMIGDRTVHVQLLQKDQYGRAVAQVKKRGLLYYCWPGFKYMDEEMLKAGFAEVYRGGGAVYGRKGKDAYVAMEQATKSRKKGMWAQANRESAAEFKARMKSES
jgi:endonuclease YncB( thermonuclease family)